MSSDPSSSGREPHERARRAVGSVPGSGLPVPEPLTALRAPVAVLFSDVDGTMTTGGRIEAATFAAIERLVAAGIAIVPVTGRSAGFGHTLLSAIPAPAVVTENGAVTFVRDGHRVIKHYGVHQGEIERWRARMRDAVDEVQAELPSLKLSTDSSFREVDLALDWNEEVSLGADVADRAVAILRQHGLAASRSNVHVNFAPPTFDKRTACMRLIADLFGGGGELERFAYVGDSLNDAPMFDGVPISVGVANVNTVWAALPHHPRYVTAAAEGAGLRELIDHLVALRAGR